MYTPSGVFRRFAFIGFYDDNHATKAAEYFNRTFIDTCKIEVQLAKPYGDKEIPRPWSRYSKMPSSKEHEVKAAEDTDKDDEDLQREYAQRLNQDTHKSKLAAYLGELYELEADPEFAEFLSLHQSKTSTQA